MKIIIVLSCFLFTGCLSTQQLANGYMGGLAGMQQSMDLNAQRQHENVQASKQRLHEITMQNMKRFDEPKVIVIEE